VGQRQGLEVGAERPETKSLWLLPSGSDQVGDSLVRPTPAAHMGEDHVLRKLVGATPLHQSFTPCTRRTRMFLLAAILLASAAQAAEPVTVTAYPWAPFISPMGEPFRGRSEDTFARWFYGADVNHDGMLTVDEMRADAERFFTVLDTDRDGRIGSEERIAYEATITPEVQINSDWKRTRQEAAQARSREDSKSEERRSRRSGNTIDGYQLDGLQGAARYGLLNLPEPVSGADADFNRIVTLDEFRRAADYRFQLLDSTRSGRPTMDTLRPFLPSRPKEGRRVKRPKNADDTRIGVPFPAGSQP
jgi:hypothetical protein